VTNDADRLATPVIAGNWKMNHGPAAAAAFMRALADAHPPRFDRTVILFPPAISLPALARARAGRSDIALGVQNVHWQADGAFTGETAAPMAVEAGAGFAIVGHSERRHIFGERDDEVGRRAAAALEAGLRPIICIGETLDERRAGRLEAVLERQLAAALDAIAHRDADFLIAYEPVWAIGTGVNATPDDAANAHAYVRRLLDARAGRTAGVPILYGGSVKPDNAADLLGAPGVDGVLVGGASLDPRSFAAIANARARED